MNPNIWTLKYLPTDEEKTFAQWGIGQDCRRELASLAPDRFTFTVLSLGVDDDPPFAPEETCVIKRNGVGFFYGRVTRIWRTARPGLESIRYELSGPWWYLDSLPFQQDWRIAIDPDDPDSSLVNDGRSRIILFQDIDGGRTSTAEMLAEVLAYVQAHGAPILVASALIPEIKPPFSEVRDMTCGELLKAILRWHPDAVSWFDYTTVTPTLHIATKSNLAAASVALSEAPASGLTISERYDLQVAGVMIIYEATNSLNEVTWTTVSKDIAGVVGLRTVVATVELGGSSRTVQQQKVAINSIDVTARSFWESLLPWLHQATGVTIENVRLNGTLVTGQVGDTADGTSGYSGMGLADFSGAALPAPSSTSNFVNVLTSGQVPHWLQDKFHDGAVTAKISYTLANPETGALEKKEKIPFSAKFKMSDLNSSPEEQTFEQQTAASDAEPLPTGVAAAYYAAARILYYEGDFVTTEEEITGLRGVGKVLNVTGGPTAWSTMAALIQSVSEDLASGTTQIRFGPPGHLAIGDFIELQRVQRGRAPSYRIHERVSGKYTGGTGAQVRGAIQVVQGANAPAAQPGKALHLGTKDPDMPGKVKIDIDDLKALLISLGVTPSTMTDPHLTFRAIDACDFTTVPPTAGKVVVPCSAFIPNP